MTVEDACEMCGAHAELKPILVDGAELLVCRKCQRYGKPVTPPPSHEKPTSLPSPRPTSPKKPILRPMPNRSRQRKISGRKRPSEESLIINPEYPTLITQARMKRGWSRQELARRLNERESVLARIETGKLVPTDDIARKLEHELKIKLLIPEEDVEETVSQRSTTSPANKQFSQTTLGSIVKIKKKKKK